MCPNYGSSNPFANILPDSQRFLVESGYDDFSGSGVGQIWTSDNQGMIENNGQVVREAAVYANGNEPMAIAVTSVNTSNGYVYGLANAFLDSWPYQIFSKTTGKPLDSKTYYSNIPIDLTYTLSMTATGSDAIAQGTIYFGDATAQCEQGSGYGAADEG